MNPLHAPIKVTVDVINRCNASCIHCRCGDFPDHGAETGLSWETITGLLIELGQMQVFRVGFSGGEPLLRNDLAEILEFAGSVIKGRLFLSTNGTLLTKDFLKRLLPIRPRFSLKMSLDGPKTIHDCIRGIPGGYDAVMNSLELCDAMGITVELTTTVMKKNLESIPDLMETVLKMPCQRHHMVELIPVGRGNLRLCLEQHERLWMEELYKKFQPLYERTGKELKWRLPFLHKELSCNGGISECGITADGSVVGCRLMPQYIAGNITNRSFRDIWNFPETAGFTIFREQCSDLNCHSCAVLEHCRGGCKAFTMGVKGDPRLRDPRCEGIVV